ncbi:MAG: deoxyribose-phosphate aldolase [Nitrospirota bacterium]
MFEDAGQLAQMIDHTLVKPDATLDDLAKACVDARKYRFAALIVNGWHVARAKGMLADSGVKVGAVVGFPHGACTTTVKIVEAMEAMKNGAEEVDIVINLGMLKSGKLDTLEIDIKNVIAMTKGVIHKIIIETSALTMEELNSVCKLAVTSGAEFIKTSTGYGSRGGTVDDIRAIRAAIGASCRVKASGGIRDLAAVKALVAAGAERIGTSVGPAIMEEYLQKK